MGTTAAARILNSVPLPMVKPSEKHVLSNVQGGQYSAIIVPNGVQSVSKSGRPAFEADNAAVSAHAER